jgi:hypothetical protein
VIAERAASIPPEAARISIPGSADRDDQDGLVSRDVERRPMRRLPTARADRTSRPRPVATSPPSASGRNTTIALPLPLSLPDPSPPWPHGRSGTGVTLRWPGGPPSLSGHGGAAFRAFVTTGAGVGGRVVACAVGLGVGRGVAAICRVGAAVGDGRGVVTGATTVGVGAVEAAGGLGVTGGSGSADGPDDGASDAAGDGPPDGSPTVAVGTGSLGVGAAGDGRAEGPTAVWVELGAGVTVTPATPGDGWLGVTNPAVSATVARMRFRSPMATTRRAR